MALTEKLKEFLLVFCPLGLFSRLIYSFSYIGNGNHDYPMARHFSEFHNANDSLLRIEGIEYIELLVGGLTEYRNLTKGKLFGSINRMRSSILVSMRETSCCL